MPHTLSFATTIHWATDKPDRKREAREAFPTLLPTLAERTSHATLGCKSAELPVTWRTVMLTLVESDELHQAESRRTNKETVTVVEQRMHMEINDPRAATWFFRSLPSMFLSGKL